MGVVLGLCDVYCLLLRLAFGYLLLRAIVLGVAATGVLMAWGGVGF